MNTKAYDDRFDQLLEQYPIPDYYNNTDNNNNNQELQQIQDGDTNDIATYNDTNNDMDNRNALSSSSDIIMEPYAMKSLLKYARNRSSRSSSTGGTDRKINIKGGGGSGTKRRVNRTATTTTKNFKQSSSGGSSSSGKQSGRVKKSRKPGGGNGKKSNK